MLLVAEQHHMYWVEKREGTCPAAFLVLIEQKNSVDAVRESKGICSGRSTS